MKTSVFICTYNRGHLINGTLRSIIIEQTKKPDEIVIVNGGGENDCNKVLNEWKKVFSPLKIIKTKNKNLASSRNVGLNMCHGDIILQTDDDARPFPDWIEKVVKFHLKYPNCGVIGGRVIDASKRNFLSKIAMESKGEVIGIIPEFLNKKEIIDYNITNTIIVKSMSERKQKLFDLGDAFLILPGGSGTIEEATEVISWKLLEQHDKKIIIYNLDNYWDPLIQMYENAKTMQFGTKNLQNVCEHVNNFENFKKIFSE